MKCNYYGCSRIRFICYQSSMHQKILVNMEVKVFLNSKSTKPIFCRIIPTNDAVDIDFKVILSCMKILFGNEIIVQFTIA